MYIFHYTELQPGSKETSVITILLIFILSLLTTPLMKMQLVSDWMVVKDTNRNIIISSEQLALHSI